jgi:hypothetical protein
MSVVNSATGTQIGSTFTLIGLPSGPPVFSADGKRVPVTTDESNKTTRVAVLQSFSASA